MCHYRLLVPLGYFVLFGAWVNLNVVVLLAEYFSWPVNICRFLRPHWMLALAMYQCPLHVLQFLLCLSLDLRVKTH